MRKGAVIYADVPYLSDVENTLEIMETLGCRCNYDSERELANISAESIFGSTIEPEMMNRMRSSILFLGSSSVSNRRGRRWLSRRL